MKLFFFNYTNILISLLFSIFLFFFIDNVAYYFGSKLFLDKYSIINKIEKNSPDMLILGSSTSKYSLNPNFLDIKSFNSSSNGNGIIYSDLILNNINDQKIKYILLGIDPANFSDTEYTENYEEMLLFDNHPYYFENLLLEIKMFNYITKKLKSFKLRSLPKIIKNYYSEINSNGFNSLYGNFIEENENYINDNTYQCSDYSLNTFSASALKNIAKYASSNDVKVIVTIVPLYAGIENSPDGMRSNNPCFFSIMKFINKVSNNNNFCDLTKDYPDDIYKLANNKNFFYDASHLNNKGADIYSKVMNTWINDICF